MFAYTRKDHKDILVTIDSVIYESGMEQAA